MTYQEELEHALIDLYESAMLHGECQANGVLPTLKQRENTVIAAKVAINTLNQETLGEYELSRPYTHRGFMDLTETSLVEATDNLKISAKNELRADLRQRFGVNHD